MRNRSRVAGLAVAVGAALLLTACVQDSPRVIPTSAPRVKPVFATDADALAAAKKAFAAYLSASDSVAHDGGLNVDRLASFDSPAQLQRDKKTFAGMHSAGEHTSGQSEFSYLTLQSNAPPVRGLVTVVTYACIDISKTQLLDQSNSQINTPRPSGVPLVLTFKNILRDSQSLVLDRSVTWQGQDFCS